MINVSYPIVAIYLLAIYLYSTFHGRTMLMLTIRMMMTTRMIMTTISYCRFILQFSLLNWWRAATSVANDSKRYT